MTSDEVQLMLYEDAQAWDKWLELMLPEREIKEYSRKEEDE